MDVLAYVLIGVGVVMMLTAMLRLLLDLRRLRRDGDKPPESGLVQRSAGPVSSNAAMIRYAVIDAIGAGLVGWGLIRLFI